MFSLFSWKKSEIIFVGAVLVAILVVSQIQLKVGQMKTRDAQRKADAELVGRALGSYYAVYKQFPPASDGKILSCGDIVDLVCDWGKDLIRDLKGAVYLNKIPADPLADQGRSYLYVVDDTRQKYRIYVSLEYRRDAAWKSNLTTQCGQELQCNWYVGNY